MAGFKIWFFVPRLITGSCCTTTVNELRTVNYEPHRNRFPVCRPSLYDGVGYRLSQDCRERRSLSMV